MVRQTGPVIVIDDMIGEESGRDMYRIITSNPCQIYQRQNNVKNVVLALLVLSLRNGMSNDDAPKNVMNSVLPMPVRL